MDDADRAQIDIERTQDELLRGRYSTLPRNGRCHFCGETVEGERLFCDNAVPGDRGCAEDFERGGWR